ncbi:hypothetical protein DL767_007172 [Monosporascus sp. MG133]|nr:hypothetical protein DL767_007172 [Monosporascus sp. MG133]
MAFFGLVARLQVSLIAAVSFLSVVAWLVRYSPLAAQPISTRPRVGPWIELVVSAVKADNTSWIPEHFPSYPTHIYIADDPTAPLTVEEKSYIIDNYHKLSDIVIFCTVAATNGVTPLQKLQIPYVAKRGFATLRCSWLLWCPLEIKPDLNAYVKWENPEADQRAKTEAAYAFAVTKERILGTTVEEYKSYRNWLWTMELTDEFSGRVMEYSWHQILGQSAVDSPQAGECFC